MPAERIEFSQPVHAPLATLWQALTEPRHMAIWMAAPEVQVNVETDWTVGGPFRITGFHHIPFENRGRVLHCEPLQRLTYSQLSSISRLPDKPENYSIFDFCISPESAVTYLKLVISQFPTESIYKHLEFYWRVTLHVLARYVEKLAATGPKDAGY